MPREPVHRTVAVNGVRLHLVEQGDGPPVLFLHGFPEFWYSWRHQLPALAAAGYWAVAVDLRGYNESSKPPGARPYRVEALAADVAGVIRHLGGRAALVGHDWGGVIAWHVAAWYPDLLTKLAVLNAPHPRAYFREWWKFGKQFWQSWYAYFFQLPWLPELLIRAGDFAAVERTFLTQARPGAFSRNDLRRYKEALRQPGALTAALNYYRAALWAGGVRTSSELPPLRVPTLLIWGERDVALDVRLTEGLEAWVPDLRVQRFREASHWVQHDRPEEVNRLLVEFLGVK